MNSLKNLLIMAVLGAVGYGLYVSLARNNVDPAYSPGAADPWQSAAQNPDKPGATPVAPGGSLPAGSVPSQPGGSLAIGSGMGPQSPADSMTQPPSYNPPSGAPNLTPVTPYPSAATSAPAAPDSLAGKPMASPSAAGGVQNLAPPPGAGMAGLAPAAESEDDSLVQTKFAEYMDEVHRKLAEGKLAEVHQSLSIMYTNPDLPEAQARQIVGLLDQLAGTVIYSRKNYLEPAISRPGGRDDRADRQKVQRPLAIAGADQRADAARTPRTTTRRRKINRCPREWN